MSLRAAPPALHRRPAPWPARARALLLTQHNSACGWQMDRGWAYSCHPRSPRACLARRCGGAAQERGGGSRGAQSAPGRRLGASGRGASPGSCGVGARREPAARPRLLMCRPQGCGMHSAATVVAAWRLVSGARALVPRAVRGPGPCVGQMGTTSSKRRDEHARSGGAGPPESSSQPGPPGSRSPLLFSPQVCTALSGPAGYYRCAGEQ
eukprot:scaffold1558_cov403-Prasinococcus_capsulatus_cf.AAC.37